MCRKQTLTNAHNPAQQKELQSKKKKRHKLLRHLSGHAAQHILHSFPSGFNVPFCVSNDKNSNTNSLLYR